MSSWQRHLWKDYLITLKVSREPIRKDAKVRWKKKKTYITDFFKRTQWNHLWHTIMKLTTSLDPMWVMRPDWWFVSSGKRVILSTFPVWIVLNWNSLVSWSNGYLKKTPPGTSGETFHKVLYTLQAQENLFEVDEDPSVFVWGLRSFPEEPLKLWNPSNSWTGRVSWDLSPLD